MTETRFHNQLGDEYELFKLASPHYDELQNSVGDLIKESFASNDTKEIEVLEIGFGAGATSIVILNSDSRVTLTAIDSEPLMLPKTAEELSIFDQNRFNLHVEDALTFLEKCPDNKFDVVASAWVIHNFTDEYRLKVIPQIYRVLKPGGIFINADKIEITDRVEHVKNMEWQLAQFEVYEEMGKPELKKEWTEHYLEDSKPGRALIENNFEDVVKSSGFTSFKILKRWYDDAIAFIKK